LQILARSIAESTYGRAKIYKKRSKDVARTYEINPKLRFLRWNALRFSKVSRHGARGQEKFP
jgi:hypothetical protein